MLLRSAASIVLLAAGLISYWFNATAAPDGPFASVYGRGDAAFAAGVAVVLFALYAAACSILWADRPQYVTGWLEAQRND